MDILDGIYPNMENHVYHSLPGISSTDIRQMLRSLAHWQVYKNSEKEHVQAFDDGSAFHTYILERHRYEQDVIILPEGLNLKLKADREKAAGIKIEKAGWKQDEESTKELKAIHQHDSKYVISHEFSQHIEKMAEAVYDHPIARKMFKKGVAEYSYFWTGADGIRRKVRPDWLTIDNPDYPDLYVDLKTTTNADPGDFGRHASTYGYHIQAQYYLDVLARTYGEGVIKGHRFVVVEKTPPYGVIVMQFGYQSMTAAGEAVHNVLSYYKHYVLNQGLYPCYAQKEYEIEIPKFGVSRQYAFDHEGMGVRYDTPIYMEDFYN